MPLSDQYIAGFFDGEGSFSIIRRKESRSGVGFSLQPYVEVANTNEKVIRILARDIGKGFTFWRPRNGNAKDAFALHITGIDSILSFIERLLPHLIVKKPVALTLKQFCLSRRGKMKLPRKKRAFTPREIRLFERIRELNKRGRHD